MAFSSSSEAKHSSIQQQPPSSVARAVNLLESVYGCFEESPAGTFPVPMPPDEAGTCSNGQRRYLWTDAFGVLNLVSLADACPDKRESYLALANRLADTVHDSLGRPRSSRPEDKMLPIQPEEPWTTTPTGFVGLRIGKTHTRAVTDAGMSYDGQYWHYTDKWLLALVRLGRVEEAAAIAKSVFVHFYDAAGGGGMRWKLSVDSTAPGPLQYQPPSDDTLTALIVFSLIEHHLQEQGDGDKAKYSLCREIDLLRASLAGYRGRVTSDPLGWGLEAMYDQWIQHKRTNELRHYSHQALSSFHMSLPFRLYGALLGAKLCPAAVATISHDKDDELLGPLVEMALRYEESKIARNAPEEHSCINRVMLASVLMAPGALGRKPGEPLLSW